MNVFQDEEDKILVMLVKVDESQQDIEEGVVDLSVTFTEARYFLVIDNAVSGGIVVNLYGAVNPDRELIDEQGGRIKMRSPPKVLTGNFRPSQLSFFLS